MKRLAIPIVTACAAWLLLERVMDFESSLLRAIMLALPDPVFVLDESGQYIKILGGQDSNYYHDGSFLKGKSLFNVLSKEKAD